MLRSRVPLMLILACLLNISGCFIGDLAIVTWQEEVKLNDGRVIVVGQKRRWDHAIARESWVTINLPDFSAQPIIWHEVVTPLVVNTDSGKLYIVGFPPTEIEAAHYGNTSPPYVAFVWGTGKWDRIPFAKVPERIYETNMLIDSFPPKGTTFLTVAQKNGPELNRNAGKLPALQRLDPNMGRF
jgi:hypothetical protein